MDKWSCLKEHAYISLLLTAHEMGDVEAPLLSSSGGQEQPWSSGQGSGLGWAGLGWPGLAWPGLVLSGLSWPGLFWSGLVRPGLVWPGLVWSGLAWPVLVPPGLAWLGLAFLHGNVGA